MLRLGLGRLRLGLGRLRFRLSGFRGRLGRLFLHLCHGLRLGLGRCFHHYRLLWLRLLDSFRLVLGLFWLGLRLLSNLVEVNLAHRLILLPTLQKGLSLVVFGWFLLGFLLLRLLGEQLLGIGLHSCIALEGFDECAILLVAELEVEVGFHLAQLLLLLEKVDGCLQADVQFSYCFI